VRAQHIPTVGAGELPADARILDVREQSEWDDGHIDGAVHVPMFEVPNYIAYQPDAVTPDERLYVICAMGGRSAQVTAWLVGHGYDAVNVAGGMNAWLDAGRPVTRG
jgi:rhodanese-related sulfurtransferase